jgi:Tol biopolymer transport system component
MMHRSLWLILLILLSACTVAVPPPPASVPTAPAAASQLPWAALHLSGRLILIGPQNDSYNLVSIDLSSGANVLIYHTPPGALLSAALVSPDGKQILLAYAPPPSAANQFTYTNLYLLPVDGAGEPQPLVKNQAASEAFYNPTWSPDGKTIYASHYLDVSSAPDNSGSYSIVKVSLDGQVDTLIQDAQWPVVSPDGARLAYLTAGAVNGMNELYLADLQGNNPTGVLDPGAYLTIDDHFFTADGKTIIFSAVNPPPAATPTVLDRFFGIMVASAHNIPSDWYSVSLAGVQINRLTQLEDTGMYAALSPDKSHIAFISQTGLYVMSVDGSGLTQLSTLIATGTVDWVP